MTKHTLGPWNYKHLDEKENVSVISEIRGKDNKFVVAYPFSTIEDSRLIAAAPELLEACKYAFGWLSSFGEHAPIVFGGEQDLHDALYAAIAKATGK